MGGVASGLAHRWGIDPILVRGLFIVAAIFLGVGVLAYGILWLLLPEPDGRIHVQEAGRGRWTSGMTGGLIVTILGLGGARAGFWFGERGFGGAFWGLFWVAVIAFAVYSIVRGSRRHHGVSPGAPATAAPHANTSAPTTGYPTAPTAAYPGAPAHGAGDPFYAKAVSAPSSADPYPPAGVSPIAPVSPPPPRPRRRGPGAAFTAVVVGAAVLAAGTLLALTLGGVVDVTGGAMWSVAAVVIGIGVLVAGLRGRTAGLLSLFAVVALVSAALSLGIERALLRGDGPAWRADSPSRIAYTPSTVDEAARGYRVSAAQGRIDLSALDDAGPLASERTVPIDVSLSDVTIEIPKDIPVTVRADATLASVDLDGRTVAGLRQSGSAQYNADRPGGTLVLTVAASLSDVTIDKEN
jgi:phage shock protein PspC (stress-responsive transcriptional regulator)